MEGDQDPIEIVISHDVATDVIPNTSSTCVRLIKWFTDEFKYAVRERKYVLRTRRTTTLATLVYCERKLGTLFEWKGKTTRYC